MARTLRIVFGGRNYAFEAQEDTTGDGQLDTATIDFEGSRYRLIDIDGDGIPDVIRIVRPDDSRVLLVHDPAHGVYRRLSDSAASDESLEENASHWFAQATEYTCGPAAITMVLADMFDVRIENEQAVWQRALHMDAITREGMRPRDIERVLDSYGLKARLVQSDTRQLERLLERGHEAILMIDAHDYWPNPESRGGDDHRLPHAVRLLGIDHERGVAVVSDTGRDDPYFSRLPIPLHVFEGAWADLQFLAVVTEVSHDDVCDCLRAHGIALIEDVAGTDEEHEEVHTTMVLPFSMQMRTLVDALKRRLGPGSG